MYLLRSWVQNHPLQSIFFPILQLRYWIEFIFDECRTQSPTISIEKMKQESDGLPLKMGLATLDKSARQRIASLGGTRVKETYDVSYCSNLGNQGWKVVLKRYSVPYFVELGREK